MQPASSEDEFASEASNVEDLDTEPGATVMWFGKHEGTRLDKLEEGYRRSLIHLSRERPSRNVNCPPIFIVMIQAYYLTFS